MTQQEFFKEWSEKYPNSFEKFKEYLQKHYIDYFYYNEEEFQYEIRLECLNEICKFEILSGVIEKFFEENNIFIDVFIDCNYGTDILIYAYNIILPKTHWNKYYISQFKTKQEAQMLAYLKSAEILEKILEA